MRADEQEVERYQRLRKKADELKQKIANDRGRAQEILSRLKEQFGCDSIEAAKELLEAKTDELAVARKALQRMCDDFDEKWGERLA